VKRGYRELRFLSDIFHHGLRGMQVVAGRYHWEKQYCPASERQQRLAVGNSNTPTGHLAASQEREKGQDSQRYPDQIEKQFHQSFPEAYHSTRSNCRSAIKKFTEYSQ
jgi:hypothetical protein